MVLVGPGIAQVEKVSALVTGVISVEDLAATMSVPVSGLPMNVVGLAVQMVGFASSLK